MNEQTLMWILVGIPVCVIAWCQIFGRRKRNAKSRVPSIPTPPPAPKGNKSEDYKDNLTHMKDFYTCRCSGSFTCTPCLIVSGTLKHIDHLDRAIRVAVGFGYCEGCPVREELNCQCDRKAEECISLCAAKAKCLANNHLQKFDTVEDALKAWGDSNPYRTPRQPQDRQLQNIG